MGMAHGLAGLFGLAAIFHRFAEGDYGAALRPAAQSKLLNNTGRTYENYKNEVGDQERHAPELLNHNGEAPDIAHADGGADAGQNEAPFALKTVARFQSRGVLV